MKANKFEIITIIITTITVVFIVIGGLFVSKHAVSNRRAVVSEIPATKSIIPSVELKTNTIAPLVDNNITFSGIDAKYIPPSEQSIIALAGSNEDFDGVISFKNNIASYPVVRSSDLSYLSKDFYGNENAAGVPCLINSDSIDLNKADNKTCNMIVFANSLKSGELFSNLYKYQNIEYTKSHNRIEYTTMFGTYEFEVMSAFTAPYVSEGERGFRFDQFYQTTKIGEFNDFYDNIMGLNACSTGVLAELGDDFITLITYIDSSQKQCMVVIGKLL